MISKSLKIDWVLFFSVTVLLLFSISAVYSSSAFYAEWKFGEYDVFLHNHLRNVAISFILMIVFSFIDYKKWLTITNFLLYTSTIFLILVLFISVPLKGASRWIDLGFINFQPSEFAKVALILYISKTLFEREHLKDEFLFVPFPIFVWISIVCFLIALQPNFSNAAIIFLISLVILFIGKIRVKYLSLYSLVMVVLGLVYGLSEGYRYKRISEFLDFLSSDGKGQVTYQTNQALIAIGNGGLFGLGPGKTQQGRLFLPESYGDFVFSIIGEEYGFIGLVVVLFVVLIILLRILRIARNSNDLFAFFLSCGVLTMISVYFLVNAFVNIGFLPTTGLPMPFVSYGGSSIVVYCISIGIIQNIHIKIKSEISE